MINQIFFSYILIKKMQEKKSCVQDYTLTWMTLLFKSFSYVFEKKSLKSYFDLIQNTLKTSI